jgi:hypothetical protein
MRADPDGPPRIRRREKAPGGPGSERPYEPLKEASANAIRFLFYFIYFIGEAFCGIMVCGNPP